MQEYSIRDDRLRQIIVDAFNALPERRDELVRLEERLRWGGLDKADEVLTRMETAMDSLEEEIREAQEAGNTDAEENTRKQLAEVREKWAAASEQRAVYADKALHIRGLQDRVRAIGKAKSALPKAERTVRETGSFLSALRRGYADSGSDRMLRRYSPVYRESRSVGRRHGDLQSRISVGCQGKHKQNTARSMGNREKPACAAGLFSFGGALIIQTVLMTS